MTKTIVTFLLDKSGSMEPIKDDTIGAFNAYLRELQKEPSGITFSLLQFESRAGVVTTYKNLPVAQAPDLSLSNYSTGDMTPLIDAAYKTIKAVEAVARKKDKVVICFQTDGQENASREHTLVQLQDLIKEKSALGWQFNFMGCGIDAYAASSRFGISQNNTVSYDRTSKGATLAAFAASGTNTRSYAAGQSFSTAYSASQKMAAGDKFDPFKGAQQAAKLATTQPIIEDVDIK